MSGREGDSWEEEVEWQRSVSARSSYTATTNRSDWSVAGGANKDDRRVYPTYGRTFRLPFS